jgi:hypothetical protein
MFTTSALAPGRYTQAERQGTLVIPIVFNCCLLGRVQKRLLPLAPHCVTCSWNEANPEIRCALQN